MVCDDGTNVFSTAARQQKGSGNGRGPSLNRCDVNGAKGLDAGSRDARAEVVRAFYDAAERVAAECENDGPVDRIVPQAIADLKDALDHVREPGSKRFTAALEAAANTYFSKVAGLDLPETNQPRAGDDASPNDCTDDTQN